MPALQNYPFGLEMVYKDTGLPRTGLVLSVVEIDSAASIALVESGEGWYHSDTVPKGTYKLYDSTSGTAVFTGVYCDHMASILREDGGDTETITRRLFEQYKIPQSYGTNWRSENIQRAIDDAVAKGVKRVVLPPGVYYMDAQVDLDAYDFEIDGCGTAFLSYPEDSLATFPMLTMNAARQTVKGIIFDGTNMAATGVSDKGLLAIENAGCIRGRIEGCVFQAATGAIGVKLEAGQDVVLVGNQFANLSIAIRVNSNTFGRLAIAGCGAKSCGATPLTKIGSGALVYEAAGNYGIPAYIEDIGTVTGGSLSGVSISGSVLDGNEFQSVFFGCEKRDNGLFYKTNGDAAYYISLNGHGVGTTDFLQIRCQDTTALAVGQQVLFPSTQMVAIDELGNISLSNNNIGDINLVETYEVQASRLAGVLLNDDAVTTHNLTDGCVTDDKIDTVDYSKITGVPSAAVLKMTCLNAVVNDGDPASDFSLGLASTKTIVAVQSIRNPYNTSTTEVEVDTVSTLTAAVDAGVWKVPLPGGRTNREDHFMLTVFYND